MEDERTIDDEPSLPDLLDDDNDDIEEEELRDELREELGEELAEELLEDEKSGEVERSLPDLLDDNEDRETFEDQPSHPDLIHDDDDNSPAWWARGAGTGRDGGQWGQMTPPRGQTWYFDPPTSPNFFGKKYFLVHTHTESTS